MKLRQVSLLISEVQVLFQNEREREFAYYVFFIFFQCFLVYAAFNKPALFIGITPLFAAKACLAVVQFDSIMIRKSRDRIIQDLQKLNFHNKTQRTIQDLAKLLNPKRWGWLNCYGKSIADVCDQSLLHALLGIRLSIRITKVDCIIRAV